MTGDNFHFDILGAPLKLALDVATVDHKKVVGWRQEDRQGSTRLVLYWTETGRGNPLPAPLEGEAIVSFVQSWLNAANYGRQPDHDGDNGRGCRVYNESWGHIDREWQAFIAIEPAWLMYGK